VFCQSIIPTTSLEELTKSYLVRNRDVEALAERSDELMGFLDEALIPNIHKATPHEKSATSF
jgi:hypothetical protein